MHQLDAYSPTYDSDIPRRRIRDEIIELVAYKELIRQMIQTGVIARYKRSFLGVLWVLLDPLFTMVVMSIVFTALYRKNLPGFPVFLLSGILPWNFLSQASTQTITSLLKGRLVGRVYLPLTVFGISSIGIGLVNLLLSFVPLLLLMPIFSIPYKPSLLFLPVAILLLSSFTLGLGLLVSAIAVFFNDVLSIYSVFLRLFFFVSGVIFSIDMLPTVLQPFVYSLPTAQLILLFRAPIYYGELPPVSSIVYTFVWSAISLVLGLWVFTRFSERYVYEI